MYTENIPNFHLILLRFDFEWLRAITKNWEVWILDADASFWALGLSWNLSEILKCNGIFEYLFRPIKKRSNKWCFILSNVSISNDIGIYGRTVWMASYFFHFGRGIGIFSLYEFLLHLRLSGKHRLFARLFRVQRRWGHPGHCCKLAFVFRIRW